MKNEHTDKEIVDVLYSDFPKIFNQICHYLDETNSKYKTT